MTIMVSRGSITSGGQKMCSRCGRRPRRPGQRYCRPCHAEYSRERRRGMVERLLTPEEWAAVKTARAAGWPVGGFSDVPG